MLESIKKYLDNPIFLKDYNIRKRKDTRKKLRIPGYVGYLAVLTLPLITIGMIFMITKEGGPEQWSAYVWDEFIKVSMVLTVYLQLFYFIFKGISYSFPLFSMEKEQRTYGGLISSMLTPGEILKGKFLVAFYPLFLELTGFLPLFIGLGLLFKLNFLQIFSVYFITLITMVFFILLGLYCSMTSRSSAKSHSRTAFIAGFLLVGTLLIDGVIASLAHDFIPFTIFLNPGAACASVLFTESHSPTWFSLMWVICPALLMLISFELWRIMNFEANRLPER